MKVRESGMPGSELWETFFDPPGILRQLGLNRECRDVVEFGCGYGTFTLPAATSVSGTVYAIDIEQSMLTQVATRARDCSLTNINVIARDFIANGTGLPDHCADFVMLFNILHTENPIPLLAEARRHLREAGRVGVIHWNYDPETPRGPPMAIRPKPTDCEQWARAAGFVPGPMIDLPPHHYGYSLTTAD